MTEHEQRALWEVLAHVRQGRTVNGSARMLGTLQEVQQALGWVPLEAVPQIAQALGETATTVAGVLSYYPTLRTDPPPTHCIRVCLGESCRAMHSDRLLKAFEQALQALVVPVTLGSTPPTVSVEQVFCVGNCAVAPTVVIDEYIHGRVSPADVSHLLLSIA